MPLLDREQLAIVISGARPDKWNRSGEWEQSFRIVADRVVAYLWGKEASDLLQEVTRLTARESQLLGELQSTMEERRRAYEECSQVYRQVRELRTQGRRVVKAFENLEDESAISPEVLESDLFHKLDEEVGALAARLS